MTTASLAVLGVLNQLEDQDSTVFSVRPSSRNCYTVDDGWNDLEQDPKPLPVGNFQI